ncbi:MAG: TolC family protein [Desulfobacterales bacterium]|nr:TolC family protein [Desulfobacterales bacterium]
MMVLWHCGKYGALFFIAMILSGACAPVGPDYRKVDPPVPSCFGSLEKGICTGEQPDKQFLTSWWKELQDPVLDELIASAIDSNLDMRIARARVRQARALAGVSAARLLPEGGPQASYDVYPVPMPPSQSRATARPRRPGLEGSPTRAGLMPPGRSIFLEAFGAKSRQRTQTWMHPKRPFATSS